MLQRQPDGSFKDVTWDEETGTVITRDGSELELNVGKPSHTILPTEDNEEEETFLTDVGRVAFLL